MRLRLEPGLDATLQRRPQRGLMPVYLDALVNGVCVFPTFLNWAWVQEAVVQDRQALDAARLAQMTGSRLQALLSLAAPMPLQEQRAALLNEVLFPSLQPFRADCALRGIPRSAATCGHRRARAFADQVGEALLKGYGGSMERLVAAAGGSAVALVDLIVNTFPGFQDRAVYRCDRRRRTARAALWGFALWKADTPVLAPRKSDRAALMDSAVKECMRRFDQILSTPSDQFWAAGTGFDNSPVFLPGARRSGC